MKQACYRTVFKRDVKRVKARRKDLKKLAYVAEFLLNGNLLPKKYKDHALTGNYKNHRECHIEPDWLLIYKREEDCIIFERTGSHSDLFR